MFPIRRSASAIEARESSRGAAVPGTTAAASSETLPVAASADLVLSGLPEAILAGLTRLKVLSLQMNALRTALRKERNFSPGWLHGRRRGMHRKDVRTHRRALCVISMRTRQRTAGPSSFRVFRLRACRRAWIDWICAVWIWGASNPIEDIDRLAELRSLSDLHLVGMGLRQIPASLDALTRLTVLDLSANPIEDIGRLAELPSLSDLRLNAMGWRQLPESLKALTRLTRLELTCNPIEDLGGLDPLSSLSSLRELRLDDMGLRRAPESLRTLTQLTILSMNGNELIELRNLSACPLLKELRVAGNQLDMADLSAQTDLSLLDLSDNQFRVPPDLSACPNLREILLWRNRLEAMPDLCRLERLTSANLALNQLRTLPPWFGNLPESLELDLSGNPLDDASLAAMAELPAGPWILHERKPAVSDPPPPLHEQVRTWLAANPEMPQDQREWLQERWKSFEHEPEADDFALLLHRMKYTADFQCGEATRRGLGRRIADTLVVLARDDALRAQSFVTAQGGLGGCEDRVALTFSSIEVSTRAKALDGKPDELLKLGRGLHRLALVEQAALADMNARQGLFVDPVEVVLSYRVNLAEPLDLPAQPARIGRQHALWTRLNEDRLDEVKQSVLNKEKADSTALVASIASQPFWQATLLQQLACAEQIAHLGAQREQQAEELEGTHEQAQARATREERNSDFFSDLKLEYDHRYGEIGRRHDEGVQSVYRQFTRIALDRVAAGAPAFDTAPPPANVIAAAKIIDIAAQLRPLVRKDEDAEARALAGQLLDPRLLAALLPSSQTGRKEAKAMEAVNVQYMKLLEALAAGGLLEDPRLVFDRLMTGSVEPRKTPYLLHIASLVGTAHPYEPGVRLRLADAAVQLLVRVAVQWACKEPQAHHLMREALASQKHGASFHERALLGNWPDSPGEMAQRLAHKLSDANLMPRSTEQSRDHAKRLESIAMNARKAVPQSSGPSTQAAQPKQPMAFEASASPAEKRIARLDAAVGALGALNVAGARVADAQEQAQWEKASEEKKLENQVRSAIASAVRSEVDRQWKDMAEDTAKRLAPSLFGGFLNAGAPAAYDEAVRSVPRTPPEDLTGRVCVALLATQLGKNALDSLTEKARTYKASEHPDFDRALRNRVAGEVKAALTPIGQRAAAQARVQISAFEASQAAEWRARANAEHAEGDAQSRLVQARSGAGEASSLLNEAPVVTQGRTRTSARSEEPQERGASVPLSPARTALLGTMPSAPHGPLGAAERPPEEHRAMPSR